MVPQKQGLVILPTYNECSNIEPLLKRILEVTPSVDILVVDDASPDGTGQIAQGIASQNPRVNVLHRTGPRGRGLAGIDGFKWALAKGYDPILEMDADFSHDPADIPRFLDKIKEADVVIGSRFVAGGRDGRRGLHRRVLSRMANAFTGLILQIPVKDRTSGFRCFRPSILKNVQWESLLSRGPAIVEELLYRLNRAGTGIIEIPIHFKERHADRSKLEIRKIFGVSLTLLKMRLFLEKKACRI